MLIIMYIVLMQYKLYIVISTNYETYTYTEVYNINVVIVFYMQAMMINLWAAEWVNDVSAFEHL